MKPRKRQPANRKKSGGGTLIGMFIGLVLGVGIAAGVVWYLNKSPLPFADKAQPPARTAPADGKNGQALAAAGVAGQAGRSAAGEALPVLRHPARQGRCGAGKEPKPEAKPAETKKDEKKDDKKEEVKESKTPLFLQAGSFSTAQDADNQKAKLAFNGYQAVVQQVDDPGQDLLPRSCRPLHEDR